MGVVHSQAPGGAIHRVGSGTFGWAELGVVAQGAQ